MKRPIRPRDVNPLVKMMVDVASGERSSDQIKQAKSSLLIHSKLRVTPAMAAGVSNKLWEVGDILGLPQAEEEKIDRTRGPYKAKIA